MHILLPPERTVSGIFYFFAFFKTDMTPSKVAFSSSLPNLADMSELARVFGAVSSPATFRLLHVKACRDSSVSDYHGVSEKTLIRVVLADDHRIFLQGLRLLLSTMPEIEVLGESWNGKDAISLIKATKPDLAIVDIDLPDIDGIEVTKRISKEIPQTRILILTGFADARHVSNAMAAGAAGYAVKDCIWEELECAIRTTATGGQYLSSRISQRNTAESNENSDALSLTPRQLQLLQMISSGKNIKEIASELGVSVKTAETHRARLMKRLGIFEVAGLVRFAIRNGFQIP